MERASDYSSELSKDNGKTSKGKSDVRPIKDLGGQSLAPRLPPSKHAGPRDVPGPAPTSTSGRGWGRGARGAS